MFRGVAGLKTIPEVVALYNKAPRAYTWMAKSSDILAKVIRADAGR